MIVEVMQLEGYCRSKVKGDGDTGEGEKQADLKPP